MTDDPTCVTLPIRPDAGDRGACGDAENDEERLPEGMALFIEKTGGVLLSQGISPQVPSALRGLTSVFGMGTGVTLSLWPPEICCQLKGVAT